MALSPMMSHYLETKEKFKDEVLFYRLGDFYEMFFDDAIKASKLLDLTLTGKDCGLTERAPMCGIPFHAADGYIAKLVSMGEKVAICEQVEDPSLSKGLVKRDVVRIVSAGTIIENELLDDKQNNYILCVCKKDDVIGVSYSDITTGEFKSREFSIKEIDLLYDFIYNLNAKEIICDADINRLSLDSQLVKHGLIPRFYLYQDISFTDSHALKSILDHFKILNVSSLGIENMRGVICSAGALLDYLSETQKHSLINISSIVVENFNDFMEISSVTTRNLELTKSIRDGKKYGTLLWVLDHTKTSMGSRLLNNMILKPLLNVLKINYRLDGVMELYKDTVLRNNVIDLLSNIRDTERIAGKISNGNVTPKDLESLGISLQNFSKVKELLSGVKSKILNDINENIYNFDEISSLLKFAITDNPPLFTKDGGYIRDGFDKELDRCRELSENSEKLIKDIEAREREATGIKTLKIGYNKVFGYFIEVTNSLLDKVPLSYIRRQTLVGAERFITEELKNLEDEIIGSREKGIRIELEIFNKIKEVLKENLTNLLKSSSSIALLDVISNFAYVSKKNSYVYPKMKPFEDDLRIVGGRHPVVEIISSESFISNDTYLNSSTDRMMIITGPNMAGKSTYMRQVALICIMAHIGCFVPAESAEIPLVDKIFTRVGASDNLVFDQSTFMVEMNEVSIILRKSTKNSLIILDEVGRGTSTYDGLSIAWAVVEYLVKKIKAKTLFATHYHELSELEGNLNGVRNYKITCKEFEGTIIFLRKVILGSANKSFGIEVASLAGVPKDITKKAKEILNTLENKDINSKKQESASIEINQSNGSIGEYIAIQKIKDIDIDELSPRKALDFIYELKKDLE